MTKSSSHKSIENDSAHRQSLAAQALLGLTKRNSRENLRGSRESLHEIKSVSTFTKSVELSESGTGVARTVVMRKHPSRSILQHSKSREVMIMNN